MFVWLVQFTDYEDDYKHRYDDGVYPETPVLFATEKEAQQNVCEQLCKRMLSEIFELKHNDFIKNEKVLGKYFDYTKWDKENEIWPELLDDVKTDYNKMVKIWKFFVKGEFVDYKFDWTIYKLTVPKAKD